jgi:TolA-binding protein
MRILLRVIAALAALSSVAALGADAKPDPAAKPDPSKAPAPAKADEDKPKADAKAEAPPPPPEKIDAKTFDLALQDYFGGNPRAAAPKLFAFIETVSQTDENYAWAQFFLGKSLADLGLKHAAAVYFAKIARERTNPAVLPRALE